MLHLLQLGEMAIPTLTAIFFEINALVIGTMTGAHFGCVVPDRRGTDVFPSGSQFLSNRFFARSRSIYGPISCS